MEQIRQNIERAKSLAHLEACGVVDWAIYEFYIAAYVAPGPDYKRVRRALGKDWKREGAHQNHEGTIWIKLVNGEGLDLTIIIDSNRANGATCRRVKVGETVQPVYKVVCGDRGGSSRESEG
jgi:hypothetical protein